MTNAIVADLAGRERLDSRRAGPRVRGRGAEGNAPQERFSKTQQYSTSRLAMGFRFMAPRILFASSSSGDAGRRSRQLVSRISDRAAGNDPRQLSRSRQALSVAKAVWAQPACPCANRLRTTGIASRLGQ